MVGGVLLLVLLGVQLGLGEVRGEARAEGTPAAAELSGAKRLSGCVVRAFRTLMEHVQCEASASAVPTVHAHGAVFARRASSQTCGVRSAVGVWHLDLPPPAV